MAKSVNISGRMSVGRFEEEFVEILDQYEFKKLCLLVLEKVKESV